MQISKLFEMIDKQLLRVQQKYPEEEVVRSVYELHDLF